MSDIRNTGGNRLSRNGERLDTYGRRSDGQKEKIVTRTDGSKVNKYWGGQGKPDGQIMATNGPTRGTAKRAAVSPIAEQIRTHMGTIMSAVWHTRIGSE